MISIFIAILSVIMITISLVEIGTNNYQHIGSKETAISVLAIGYVVLSVNAVLCGIYGSCCRSCENTYNEVGTTQDVEKNVDGNVDGNEKEDSDECEDEEIDIQVNK